MTCSDEQHEQQENKRHAHEGHMAQLIAAAMEEKTQHMPASAALVSSPPTFNQSSELKASNSKGEHEEAPKLTAAAQASAVRPAHKLHKESGGASAGPVLAPSHQALEMKTTSPGKLSKPSKPSKPSKTSEPSKVGKGPGRTTLASSLSQLPPGWSEDMLKPLERKLQDGRGVYPGAPGSGTKPPLTSSPNDAAEGGLSPGVGLVVFDGNDGTGFASMLRKALLKHSVGHSKSTSKVEITASSRNEDREQGALRRQRQEGEQEELEKASIPPSLRLRRVLDRAQKRLQELHTRRPSLTSLAEESPVSPWDKAKSDVRSSVDEHGTVSNRLFKLLGPDDEDEEREGKGQDSISFGTDSQRSVEIRRIHALKRKRRRKRVKDAAEASLIGPRSSLSRAAMSTGESKYASATSSLSTSVNGIVAYPSSGLGLNASHSRGLDPTQNRRSRYLLPHDDYRLVMKRVPLAFKGLMMEVGDASGCKDATEDEDGEDEIAGSDEAKVSVVSAKTGTTKLARNALAAVSRRCLHRGLGVLANRLLAGTIYCGWVQRYTSTGLRVTRYLTLTCDDWPDVQVFEGSAAATKPKPTHPHEDLSEEKRAALKASSSLVLNLYESAVPSMWGSVPVTLKARTRIVDVMQLKSRLESTEGQGKPRQQPGLNQSGRGNITTGDTPGLDFSGGKGDPRDFSVVFKVVRTARGVNQYGSEGSSHSVTQSSRPMDVWHFRCDTERERLSWTRLLTIAMQIVHHPSIPTHTRAYLPLPAAGARLAVELGINPPPEEAGQN